MSRTTKKAAAAPQTVAPAAPAPELAPEASVEKPVTGGGLGLVPNPVVGYRIVPDWNSFNVQLVKRRGATSKQAGQEYGETIAYCRSLEFATRHIIQHATRVYGEELQDAALEVRQTVGDAEALAQAIVKAQDTAMAAVLELQARIDALGLDRKGLVQALGEATDAPAADTDAA